MKNLPFSCSSAEFGISVHTITPQYLVHRFVSVKKYICSSVYCTPTCQKHMQRIALYKIAHWHGSEVRLLKCCGCHSLLELIQMEQ